MSDASLSPADSPLPEGGGASSERGASSVFAIFVGLGMMALFAFFGLAILAVGMRFSRADERAPSAATTATPSELPGRAASPLPTPATATPIGRAVVNVPKERKTGVLRAKASTDSPIVAFVPAGTSVELYGSTTATSRYGPQTWYRVRAVVGGKAYEGFMHGDILRRE